MVVDHIDLVIALICGALLAGVNSFTAPEIERAKSEKVAALLSEFYSQEDGYLFDEDTTSKKEKYINTKEIGENNMS